ncbi:Asp/Glu racemase [Micromonospora sp. NBC_00362]|uniref:maleate cis-trans isomerase family protein n=1 Tax=Micromonospora sp. NBC_00362 TaxID=2975975 RepID=UPI0022512530|nr:Asp/Glu racemase [Micromonospora sp. NBC_00362]MCX5116392.1 Asp/Glu racemase [Micromonospora sp. NBC_00362]
MSGYRIGLVVPSSNTTMETEIPAMLRRREAVDPTVRFTTHASRVRLRQVTADELARMNRSALRCAAELADARCDVLAYACLVAVMCEGAGAHERAERRLGRAAGRAGHDMPVVTSAGALVAGLRALGARRVALVAPYLPPLTATVVAYLAAYGVRVTDAVSLCEPDNVAVGRIPAERLVELAGRLDVTGVDAVVLSACVQLPSLAVVPLVEAGLGRPVLTAATATVHQLLTGLGVEPYVPDAGRLLAGPIPQ